MTTLFVLVLNLFTFVKFDNDECHVNGTTGICYTFAECKLLKGTVVGPCASGFGVCCQSKSKFSLFHRIMTI